MPTNLPAAADITGNTVTEAQAKTAFTALLASLRERGDPLAAFGNVQNLGLAFSVAANAITCAVKQRDGSTNADATNVISVAMRHATVGNGGFNVRNITSALSLVISSGSTLGHTNGAAGYIYWYLIDNAGALELAASSKFFGSHGIVSTTAEGGAGAADSATVMYSATARSNVPFICIGRTQDTQTTAGTWTSLPSEVLLYPFISNYVDKAGDTLLGKLTGKASDSSSASFNVPHGSAPSSPVDGDVWTTSSGLYARINGVTYQFGSQVLPEGHINGFLPTSGWSATSATTAACTISAGQAVGGGATLITKPTTTNWAVSNGNAINGYSGGTTLPNNSTINFFICSGSSGIGVFASTSASPTFPTGYNSDARLIFQAKTNGSGAIKNYVAVDTAGGGYRAILVVAESDNPAIVSGSRTTITCPAAPTGRRLKLIMRASMGTNPSYAYISSLDVTDVAPAVNGTAPGASADQAGTQSISNPDIITNTSAQFGARASTSTNIFLYYDGWEDSRRPI